MSKRFQSFRGTEEEATWWYEDRGDGWRVLSSEGFDAYLAHIQRIEERIPVNRRWVSNALKDKSRSVITSRRVDEDGKSIYWFTYLLTNEQAAASPRRWPEDFAAAGSSPPFAMVSAMPGPLAEGLEKHGGGPKPSSGWMPYILGGVAATAAAVWYMQTNGGKKPFKL